MKKKKINWTNYFIELVIVVLGVTIAFAISRYSENVKNKQKEQVYLESFLDELHEELDGFVGLDSIVHLKIKYANILLNTSTDSLIANDSLTIYLESSIASFNVSTFSKQTFETLKASGDLDIISSLELRKKMFKYYGSTLIGIETLQKFAYDYFHGKTLTFFVENSFSDNKTILVNPQFRQQLTVWISIYVGMEKALGQVIEETEGLIEEMEKCRK